MSANLLIVIQCLTVQSERLSAFAIAHQIERVAVRAIGRAARHGLAGQTLQRVISPIERRRLVTECLAECVGTTELSV